MTKEQAKFKFKGYRVTKSLMKLAPSGAIDKNLNVTFSGIKDGECDGEYMLDLGVSVTNSDNSLCIELEMRGMFEFDRNLGNDEKSVFFTSSAPAIMFPYLRAHVAALTALSGTEALVLPTLNFAAGMRRAKMVD